MTNIPGHLTSPTSDLPRPRVEYKFRGRSYTTVFGLCRALMRDSGASEIGSVTDDHKIKAWGSRNDKSPLAIYSVEPPKIGAAMTVTRDAP